LGIFGLVGDSQGLILITPCLVVDVNTVFRDKQRFGADPRIVGEETSKGFTAVGIDTPDIQSGNQGINGADAGGQIFVGQ
jgi:hypothetical protein